MNDLCGQSLGRYHLIEKLGEGGMAIVYKAFDTRLECEVAVKVIRMERLTQEMMATTLKRFEREAKAVAKLNHPNIVNITDFGEHEDVPYLVMEYLNGGTLKQYLGRPLPYQDAIRLLAPIARALQYAHTRNIIHRDVKPSNILITESGEPMLTDFGIAKILDLQEGQTLTGTGVGIGTPEYMAPEQWSDKISPAVDVYALGVVFFELITGHKPFTADNPADVLIKSVSDPLPRPSSFIQDLPSTVEQMLFKALAKKTEDRYQTMAEFENALVSIGSAGQAPKYTYYSSRSAGETVEDAATFETSDTHIDPANLKQVENPISPPFPTYRADNSFESHGDTQDRKQRSISEKILSDLAANTDAHNTYLKDKLEKKKPSRREPKIKVVSHNLFALIQRKKRVALWGGLGIISLVGLFILIGSMPNWFLGNKSINPSLASISPIDGMEMVYVPEGNFIMGSPDGVGDRNEHPQHTVNLDAFWIDKTEVTNAMYMKCVVDGACSRPTNSSSRYRSSYFSDPKFVDYPVIYVTWSQAKAYCEWAGRELPTEAQWEKAARGESGLTYPWGNNSPNSSLANFHFNNADTTPVGNYPAGASPYGALDMAGNVWEWTADWYDENYYSNGIQSNPSGPGNGKTRVLRGGSWSYVVNDIRSAYRVFSYPSVSNNSIGFRCALPLQ